MSKVIRIATMMLVPLIVAPACVPGPDSQTTPTDRYTPPQNGDVQQLVQFVEVLMSFKPATVYEKAEYDGRAPVAVRAACERIIELEMDKTSPAYEMASRFLLQFEIAKLNNGSPKEQRDTVRMAVEHFSNKEELSTADADAVRKMIGSLEDSETQGARMLAADAYDQFAELFSAHGGKDVEPLVKRFEGGSRRLQGVGQQFELSGRTIDGKEFEISSLRGKVVLVDFWATWCGPCVAELPNVKELYERYQEQGFEVVGVSLDQELPTLKSFLRSNEIPWATVPAYSGSENPVLAYYGVFTIPQMILVDQEGKIIATGLRGEELNAHLKSIFGANANSEKADG